MNTVESPNKSIDSSELSRINERFDELNQRLSNTKSRIYGKVDRVLSFDEKKDSGLEEKMKEPNSFIETMQLQLNNMNRFIDELDRIDDHLSKIV